MSVCDTLASHYIRICVSDWSALFFSFMRECSYTRNEIHEQPHTRFMFFLFVFSRIRVYTSGWSAWIFFISMRVNGYMRNKMYDQPHPRFILFCSCSVGYAYTRANGRLEFFYFNASEWLYEK